MISLLYRIFLVNWPRKLLAVVSAVVIWFLVNQSMTVIKVFPAVPVKVINILPNKTVSTLLPNGCLSKKSSLTVKGPKGALDELDSSDMEIIINAEGKEESFIAKIDKKNLCLLAKDDKMKNSLLEVKGDDIFIKITNLITEEIPLTILPPIGDPPPGFQYLDIFPKRLVQKLSGPQEEVEAIKRKGLELTFDLDKITKEELEAIKTTPSSSKSDEVSFFIPPSWKNVTIPFHGNVEEALNDPRAQYLRIDFLKNELLHFDASLPILLFFPAKNNDSLNPETSQLTPSPLIEKKHGLSFLTLSLNVRGVSRHFLEIVKDNIALCVIVEPKEDKGSLDCTLLIIDERALEEKFISSLLNENAENNKYNQESLKKRFRSYVNNMTFFTEQEVPLRLHFSLDHNQVIVQ